MAVEGGLLGTIVAAPVAAVLLLEHEVRIICIAVFRALVTPPIVLVDLVLPADLSEAIASHGKDCCSTSAVMAQQKPLCSLEMLKTHRLPSLGSTEKVSGSLPSTP